jgi:hypothetical protein
METKDWKELEKIVSKMVKEFTNKVNKESEKFGVNLDVTVQIKEKQAP